MSAEPIQFPSRQIRALDELRYVGAKITPASLTLWERLLDDYGADAVIAACRRLQDDGKPGWIDEVSGLCRRIRKAHTATAPAQSVDAILTLMQSADGQRKVAADHLRKLAIDDGIYSLNLRTGEQMAPDAFTVAAWASRRPDLVKRLRGKALI